MSVQSFHMYKKILIKKNIFNLTVNKNTRTIASIKMTQSVPIPKKLHKPDLDPGSTNVPLTNTFESSSRHGDVTQQALSERWGISLATATKTLKKTSQKFLRSAILPLSRRYKVDRMFIRKTLSGDWSTNTMDGTVPSSECNKYARLMFRADT